MKKYQDVIINILKNLKEGFDRDKLLSIDNQLIAADINNTLKAFESGQIKISEGGVK